MEPGSKESHWRSVLKALTWRLIASLTTYCIAYFITGETAVALSIAGIEAIAKMFVYYLHERAWQQLPRGSVRKWFK